MEHSEYTTLVALTRNPVRFTTTSEKCCCLKFQSKMVVKIFSIVVVDIGATPITSKCRVNREVMLLRPPPGGTIALA